MAKELKINYSTAKTIFHVYKSTGRTEKIPHKLRKPTNKGRRSRAKKAPVSKEDGNAAKNECGEQNEVYFGRMKIENEAFNTKVELKCEENIQKIEDQATEWRHEREPEILERRAQNELNVMSAQLQQNQFIPFMEMPDLRNWNVRVNLRHSYLEGIEHPIYPAMQFHK